MKPSAVCKVLMILCLLIVYEINANPDKIVDSPLLKEIEYKKALYYRKASPEKTILVRKKPSRTLRPVTKPRESEDEEKEKMRVVYVPASSEVHGGTANARPVSKNRKTGTTEMKETPASDRVFFPPYKMPFWGLPYGIYSNGGFVNPGLFPFVPGGPGFPPYDGVFGGPFGPGTFPGPGLNPFAPGAGTPMGGPPPGAPGGPPLPPGVPGGQPPPPGAPTPPAAAGAGAPGASSGSGAGAPGTSSSPGAPVANSAAGAPGAPAMPPMPPMPPGMPPYYAYGQPPLNPTGPPPGAYSPGSPVAYRKPTEKPAASKPKSKPKPKPRLKTTTTTPAPETTTDCGCGKHHPMPYAYGPYAYPPPPPPPPRLPPQSLRTRPPQRARPKPSSSHDHGHGPCPLLKNKPATPAPATDYSPPSHAPKYAPSTTAAPTPQYAPPPTPEPQYTPPPTPAPQYTPPPTPALQYTPPPTPAPQYTPPSSPEPQYTPPPTPEPQYIPPPALPYSPPTTAAPQYTAPSPPAPPPTAPPYNPPPPSPEYSTTATPQYTSTTSQTPPSNSPSDTPQYTPAPTPDPPKYNAPQPPPSNNPTQAPIILMYQPMPQQNYHPQSPNNRDYHHESSELVEIYRPPQENHPRHQHSHRQHYHTTTKKPCKLKTRPKATPKSFPWERNAPPPYIPPPPPRTRKPCPYKLRAQQQQLMHEQHAHNHQMHGQTHNHQMFEQQSHNHQMHDQQTHNHQMFEQQAHNPQMFEQQAHNHQMFEQQTQNHQMHQQQNQYQTPPPPQHVYTPPPTTTTTTPPPAIPTTTTTPQPIYLNHLIQPETPSSTQNDKNQENEIIYKPKPEEIVHTPTSVTVPLPFPFVMDSNGVLKPQNPSESTSSPITYKLDMNSDLLTKISTPVVINNPAQHDNLNQYGQVSRSGNQIILKRKSNSKLNSDMLSESESTQPQVILLNNPSKSKSQTVLLPSGKVVVLNSDDYQNSDLSDLSYIQSALRSQSYSSLPSMDDYSYVIQESEAPRRRKTNRRKSRPTQVNDKSYVIIDKDELDELQKSWDASEEEEVIYATRKPSRRRNNKKRTHDSSEKHSNYMEVDDTQVAEGSSNSFSRIFAMNNEDIRTGVASNSRPARRKNASRLTFDTYLSDDDEDDEDDKK